MGYEKWEDPSVIGENVLPAHAAFSEEDGISLNGEWYFSCEPSPEQVPENFYKEGYDVTGWEKISVPGCWETKGYGAPWYFGAGFPSAVNTSKKKIPQIDHKKTYTGAYRRSFFVPEEWQGKQVILRFGSVKSAFYCWINGTYVGMGKGSMLPVEFDVTEFVRQGENTVSAKVYQFSDATYLEDQDMWFMSGIYRDVTLYARPRAHIADVYAKSELDGEYRDAKLYVEVKTENVQNATAENVAVESAVAESVAVENAAGGEGATHGGRPRGADVTMELLWQGNVEAQMTQAVLGDVVSFVMDCKAVRLWTAETPNLYQVRVTLRTADKKSQTRVVDFGFRQIEINREKAQLLLNGMPLKLRGINYHAFTPDNGYYVPREVYERDLRTMKRFNVNAVRTSHYPQDEYFYTLCNRYGIYVMDECNVESHGVRDKDVPGDNPVWNAHVVDRMERMVARDRNHPCVVIWSLGNESSIGMNHYCMKEAALALDATRPVHYEGGSDLKVSDFLCDGYSSPEREMLFAEGKDVEKKPGVLQMLLPLNMSLESIKFEDYKHHPIVATEYGHCMGNGCSDVEKHMEVFEGADRWCGGFIWDFKDKSLTKGEIGGKPVQTYGGDWGVKDQAGNICCNGAADWNGKPHEVFYEIQKAFQPLVCLLKEGRRVEITNRHSFTDAGEYLCRWELARNGKRTEGGELTVHVEPRKTGVVEIPYESSLQEAGVISLKVEFSLRKDLPWARAGHVVAYEQWILKETKPSGRKGEVTITQDKEEIRLITKSAVYRISKKTGNVEQIEAAGKVWLKTPLRPSFFRAITDSDAGFIGLAMGRTKQVGFWGDLSLDGIGSPKSLKVTKDGVTVIHEWKKNYYGRSYRVTEDGGLLVSCVLRTGKKNVPARFGMQMELDGAYDSFTWFGKGPHDIYWGREYSGMVEIHRKKVEEQDEHVRPQEHGNKQGVRWLTLTDKEGSGLRVECMNKPVAASAWPYTLRQLQDATHVHELSDHEQTTLNIDGIQNGLGDCFVPCPDRYKIRPETRYQYGFKISVTGK